jgi:hypothetical protein
VWPDSIAAINVESAVAPIHHILNDDICVFAFGFENFEHFMAKQLLSQHGLFLFFLVTRIIGFGPRGRSSASEIRLINFNFDDNVVPADARIDTSLDLDFYVVNLAYNFFRTKRAKFGFGVGMHAADIDLEIAAEITAGDQDKYIGERHAKLLAPLPNLFAGGAYAFTEKFIARFGGGWMSLKYGDYDGRLLAANAHLEYWPFKHAGLGAGYRYMTIDFDYDDGDKEEEYNLSIPGPVLYMIFGF